MVDMRESGRLAAFIMPPCFEAARGNWPGTSMEGNTPKQRAKHRVVVLMLKAGAFVYDNDTREEWGLKRGNW